MDKRDRIEELFHERLYNFEYNPGQDDWKKITDRLSSSHLLSRKRINRVAAAIALLLLTAGSLLFINHNIGNDQKKLISGIPAHKTKKFPSANTGNSINSTPIDSSIVFIDNSNNQPTEKSISDKKSQDKSETITNISDKGVVFPSALNSTDKNTDQIIETNQPLPLQPILYKSLANRSLPVNINPQSQRIFTKNNPRKWRIGMGSGSLGLAGITNGAPGIPDQSFCDPNDPKPKPGEPEKIPPVTRAKSVPVSTPEATKIKHGYPISFGVSLSKPLTERWNLHTGLNYSFLRTKWNYEYSQGTAQTLRSHLIGIPLSVSYRLTDWQRPYCYLSAGILAEINIAGKLRKPGTTYHARVPGVLWTANTRIGLSYPLIRFVSVYAEGGVCYYFNYRGYLKTIRSENAFNMTGQIGFRLNF